MKRDGWEGGHRVPFIARWPRAIPAGQVSRQMTNTTDIFATLASVVGYELKDEDATDSFDMLPAMLGIQDEDDPIRPHLLTQSFKGDFQIRQGEWKFLDHMLSGGEPGNNYSRGFMAQYLLPETAPDATGQSDIPVGAYYGDYIGDPVDKMNAEKLGKDKASFGNTIVLNQDAEELTRLARRLLISQEDNSVTYVTVGHTKGLYDILVSEPDAVSSLHGVALIKRKVKRWVALGALSANREREHYGKDWNFFFNGTAPYTKHLIDHFPKAMVFVTCGTDVLTGKSLKTTPADNIVRAAYEEWLRNYSGKTLDDQRSSWDLIAIYYAVEGLGDYLASNGKGHLEFDIEKGCRWVKARSKTSQTLIRQQPGTNKGLSDYLNHLIALPPKCRQ